MKCVFANVGPSEKREGWHKYRCMREDCGLIGHSPHADVWVDGYERVIGPACKGMSDNLKDIRGYLNGPGTQLKQIFDSLGIVPKASCPCERLKDWMNWLGPKRCIERREALLTYLRKGYDEATIAELARAWILATVKFLPTTIEGLLDLAIERAEPLSSPL